MNKDRIAEIDGYLTEIDRQCIAAGEPIMSIIVRVNGKANPVTLASIKKYNLALPNESLPETISRLSQEAFTYYKKGNRQ